VCQQDIPLEQTTNPSFNPPNLFHEPIGGLGSINAKGLNEVGLLAGIWPSSQDAIKAQLPRPSTPDTSWLSTSASFGVDAEYPATFAQHHPLITHPGELANWMSWPGQGMQSSIGVGGMVEGDLHLHKSDTSEKPLELLRSAELLKTSTMRPPATTVAREDSTPPHATPHTTMG
jgi:hypothetical protein